MPTKIAWTDESWNPITGCTPVSEGCKECYAEKLSKRFGWSWDVALHPDRLDKPLTWRNPRMVFVPSMGDLFHEDVPDSFINRVFGVMARRRDHTFQVLTKRPERMHEWVQSHVLWLQELAMMMTRRDARASIMPHIWLGVSVENQARADERIPLLLETPAAVRFVSAEPLLGPLDLTRLRCNIRNCVDMVLDSLSGRAAGAWKGRETVILHDDRIFLPGLDWVIVGGESGGPPERRLVERCVQPWHDTCRGIAICSRCRNTGWRPKPKALEWVRSIREQCQAAGVPFFFKQWGPRAGQGTLLDGREHKEMPRQEVRA